MRRAKRPEPRWVPRQKARAKPEGAAIHQKDTVTGVFLFGHSIIPKSRRKAMARRAVCRSFGSRATANGFMAVLEDFRLVSVSPELEPFPPSPMDQAYASFGTHDSRMRFLPTPPLRNRPGPRQAQHRHLPKPGARTTTGLVRRVYEEGPCRIEHTAPLGFPFVACDGPSFPPADSSSIRPNRAALLGPTMPCSPCGPPSAAADLPRWLAFLDFPAQMNLVASMLSQSRWAT